MESQTYAIPSLSKVFKQKPAVTYRKNKLLSDYFLKNGIENQQLHSNVAPCGILPTNKYSLTDQ